MWYIRVALGKHVVKCVPPDRTDVIVRPTVTGSGYRTTEVSGMVIDDAFCVKIRLSFSPHCNLISDLVRSITNRTFSMPELSSFHVHFNLSKVVIHCEDIYIYISPATSEVACLR